MKENKYDDKFFFESYSRMTRSTQGLEGAGEWHILKKMLPNLTGKRVLDLGCGYGWHCRYAIENGASYALGTDISEKMIAEANKINSLHGIEYRVSAIENMELPVQSFDVVLSSLTFHYLESFDNVAKNIHDWLVPGGHFVFSVEHPIFTAYGSQDWHYGNDGEKLHWPVDGYFSEGKRVANFLNHPIVKYHKTLTTYINGLLKAEFDIKEVIEPSPSEEMLDTIPEMREELRRPMMMLVSAIKR